MTIRSRSRSDSQADVVRRLMRHAEHLCVVVPATTPEVHDCICDAELLLRQLGGCTHR